jgi:hypothetical protein
MNTLQSHIEEFSKGIVTELGYAALADAEGYGAASSIGAGCNTITMLWEAFSFGKPLALYSMDKTVCNPGADAELADWCESNFPSCYGEFLRRSK